MVEARFKKLHIVYICFCIICSLIILDNHFNFVSDDAASKKTNSVYECECPCHKEHQEEEELELQKMRQEREILKAKKRKACLKEMQEQADYIKRFIR